MAELYRAPYEQEPLHVPNGFDLMYDGTPSRLKLLALSDNKGLMTRLDDHFWLNWDDILDKPVHARLHLFPGESKEITLEQKLDRMQRWARAISVYDSIMLPESSTSLRAPEVTDILKGNELPRVGFATIETGTEGLRNLFQRLGFGVSEDLPHTFIAEWTELTTLAKSGKLIEAWLAT